MIKIFKNFEPMYFAVSRWDGRYEDPVREFLFYFVRLPLLFFLSYSYLKGATAADLRWQLPNMDVRLDI